MWSPAIKLSVNSKQGPSPLAPFNLSRDVPMKLANDDNVMHLLWLFKDKYAKITWDYVYENLFKRANRNSLGNPHSALVNGIPIEARPPYMEQCNLTLRGITVNNDTLILEIMSITGLDLPYKYITYTHPGFYQLEKVSDPKTARRVRKKEETEYELDHSQQSAQRQSNPSTIDNAKLRYGFNGYYKVKKTSKRTNIQRTGKHEGDRIIEGRNVTDNVIVSAQDWAYGGEIKPVEFKLLEAKQISSAKGLEEFLQAIQYINKTYKDLDLQISIVFLPEGKGFSSYPNGYRRTCAIVNVKKKDQLPCYILEIGRADNWSISTLLIYQLSNLDSNLEIELLINKVLDGVVNNNGHWDKAFLLQENQYKFDIMKHVSNQSIHRWAERMIYKIVR